MTLGSATLPSLVYKDVCRLGSCHQHRAVTTRSDFSLELNQSSNGEKRKRKSLFGQGE